MTSFSARHALGIVIAAALALAPMLYARSRDRGEACRDLAAFLTPEAVAPGIELVTEGSRKTDIDRGRITGWIGTTEPGNEMVVTVSRSFGLTPGLLQPASLLPGRREPDVVEAARFETPEGPVIARYGYERISNRVRITAYFMAYEGRTIDSPLWARLKSGPRALLHGPTPVTLFAASTQSNTTGIEDAKLRLEEWMLAAWRHYRATCHEPPR